MFSHEIFTLKFSSCSILLAPIFPVKVEKSFELFFMLDTLLLVSVLTQQCLDLIKDLVESDPWHSWYECGVQPYAG